MVDKELLAAIGEMMDEKLDKRFAELEKKMDARFAEIDSRFSDFDSRLTTLERDFAEMRKELEAVKVAVLSNGEAIARVESKIPELEAVVRSNCYDISYLKNRVS